MMTPALRRFTFTTHITSSVGWVGAALAFLALAVIGFTSDDPAKVRGAYLLMAPAAWFVLVPLAHASLLSGVVLSLGTTWGLFRHYWVVLKLGITVFATVILLIYMGRSGKWRESLRIQSSIWRLSETRPRSFTPSWH